MWKDLTYGKLVDLLLFRLLDESRVVMHVAY